MKKLLSMRVVLVVLVTMLPVQSLAAETSGCTITVTIQSGNSGRPNGGSSVSVTGKYVIVNDALYYFDGQGAIVNTDLTPATLAAGSYTIYYGPYDTVTLSAENGWSYTWDLTDEFQWTVDEPSVPSGYTKTVRRDGNSFTITNTYEDIPKTGDAANLFGLSAMTAVGVVGFGVTLLSLIAPRKKEEDEQ